MNGNEGIKRRKTDGWMKDQTVTNIEGKFNGVLQTKVWKPGEAIKYNIIRGQQLKGTRRSLRNKVWDPGGQ